MHSQDPPEGLVPTLALGTEWQAGKPPQDEHSPPRSLGPGESVGPFELLGFLGRGAMGQVYKARDTRLDRILALKLLLPGPPAFEQRFQREAWAQAKVDHSGVCKVYEVGTADARTYIAMEFLDGQTLAEVAESLTLEEKVSVIHQVAEAVHAAHRQALVHRDLKPGNIMVQRVDGRLKAWVLDFGIVYSDDDAQLTRTGEVVGTPLYMAPEQVRGEMAAVDRRTDVYSLGAMLYELLTGQPPILGGNILELLQRISDEDPLPPRQLRSSIPEDLEWIVLRCLEKDPGRRYASAAALVRDLERFRSGEPVDARQSTWRYRLTKRIRKHRHVLVVGGLLVALLVGIAWRDLTQRRDAARATDLTAKFLRQVEQIEWRTRLIAALPMHDTRPEKVKMLAELEALEREVDASGEVARGPGLLALGRGYHVLGDLDRGLAYLEQAWEAGNRDPILSFDLGLAYGEKYEEYLLRSRQAADPDIQQQLEQEATARYRAPAIEHFRRAQQSGAGDSTWARALLATYEERWDEALEALATVEAASPWRYETHIVRSTIWRTRAREDHDAGRDDDALEKLERAAETLQVALRKGESDSRAYTALCEVRALQLDSSEDPRIHTDAGRQELLDPCLQATRADSGSVNAWNSAATTAEALAVRLIWVGSGESKDYFERSKDWAQRAANLDPQSLGAAQLLTRNHINLGSLCESTDERTQHFDQALDQAQRAVDIAPEDLETVITFVDVTAAIAGYASLLGEDVEPLYETAAAAMESLIQHPSPLDTVWLRRVSLESQRADWYATRGGDADGALARARQSVDALDPSQPMDGYGTWIMADFCISEAYADFSKDTVPTGLDDCREFLAQQVAASPDDLEWAIAESDLMLLVLQVDPSQADAILPRMESLLQRLGESDMHRDLFYDRFLGHWRIQQAQLAEGSARVAWLGEAIDAFSRSIPQTGHVADQLIKAGAQLHLAELERRRRRPEVARELLAQSRLDLAEVESRDPQRLRSWLLGAVADRIEAELDGPADPASPTLVTTMSPEVDSHVGWDALLAEPYLRSDVRWWRTFLEGEAP